MLFQELMVILDFSGIMRLSGRLLNHGPRNLMILQYLKGIPGLNSTRILQDLIVKSSPAKHTY